MLERILRPFLEHRTVCESLESRPWEIASLAFLRDPNCVSHSPDWPEFGLIRWKIGSKY